MDPDSCLLRWTEFCDGITVMPLSLGAAIALLLALALLYTSGFVSASEIAFFSLSPSDLNDIEEENHPSDSKIKALLDDSERLLATILISNNFVNVTIIMLLNYVFASVIDFGEAKILEFLIVTVVLTFLLLLFGEIMPKIYSAQHTLPFDRKAAPVVTVLRTVFWPISSLLVRSSFFINRFSQKRKVRNLTVNELYKEGSNSDCFMVALDANGNTLPYNESTGNCNNFAIQDRDISTVDIYFLDYVQYMDELKGQQNFDNPTKEDGQKWKKLLEENAKYHKTLHFDNDNVKN